MSIVTRSLESVQQSGGTVLASFLAIDSNGLEWRKSASRFANEAAAITASDAFDWGPQLQDFEEDKAIAFIKKGGDPGTFVKSDLTAAEFNIRLAKRFAKAIFAEDREFMCNIADWITGFTANQIENSLGISTANAQKILDRATHIRGTICAALVTDDGRIQEIN